jgi:hypothetical protein
LKRCEQLRELYLNKFVSAPAILTHVSLNNNTRLRKLGVEKGGYTLKDNQEFHQALSHQTMLESLRLAADDAEPNSSLDKDTLVSSICQLTKLSFLDLCQTSDYFSTPDINRITASLPGLETFKFTGYGITDNVWHSLSGYVLASLPQILKSCKRFCVHDSFLSFTGLAQKFEDSGSWVESRIFDT